MKTTPIVALGAWLGTCLWAAAQGGPGDRPDRPKHHRHGPPPAEVIQKFDKDGDGKLSPEEREAMREERKARMKRHREEMLKKFDADGDGKLSPDERKKAAEERKKIAAERRAKMIETYDKDGDGKLSPEERAAMPKRPQGPPEGRRDRKGKGDGSGRGPGPAGGPPPGAPGAPPPPPPPPAE